MHRILTFTSIICALTLLIACKKEAKPQQPPAINVTEFTVAPKTIPAVFEFIGFAQSSHPVEIRARVEGYLDEIAYQEGQIVKEGELMFQLDPKQYEALVEQAKAEVSKQEAILENAKLTVERLTPLYHQKAASKKDLDNAIAAELSAKASVQAAKAQLLTNEINLGYTTIRSPIKGFSDKSQYREGALITPGPNGLLTTVSVMDPIWVYFSVSDNDILQSRQEEHDKTLTLPKSKNHVTIPQKNQWKIQAVLSDGTVYPKWGKVDFSSPTYDQSTGTLLVRGVFPNPKGILRPGQFIRVKMYGAQHPNALYVPQRALVQNGDGMNVYLINKDNTVTSQDVTTGEWYNNFQIITNGLKPGDRIVVDGTNKLRQGMQVNVTGPWTPSTDADSDDSDDVGDTDSDQDGEIDSQPTNSKSNE